MSENRRIEPEIREKLRAPFPPEAISQHPTKSFLSTIKAIYITERLNDIFGIGGWTLEHEIISDTPEYVAVRGRIIIVEPYNIRTPDQYGGHGKTGTNTEPADGYKSAMTDCQSKCASYLEIGIDVFKGKADKPKRPAVTKEDVGHFSPSTPEATTKQIITALKKKLGAKMKMDDPEKKKFYDWITQGEDVTVDRLQHYIDKYDDFVISYEFSKRSDESKI